MSRRKKSTEAYIDQEEIARLRELIEREERLEEELRQEVREVSVEQLTGMVGVCLFRRSNGYIKYSKLSRLGK